MPQDLAVIKNMCSQKAEQTISHCLRCVLYDYDVLSICSPSGWGSWESLLSELSEGNTAILVSVHLVDDLVDFLVRHPVPTGLDHSLELDGVNGSIVVQVKGVEGLVAVESWPGVESLSQALGGGLNSEVCPPHVLELESGVWEEAVISSNWSWGVVGWSSGHGVSVVSVVGKEGSLELVSLKSSVSALVVSLYEEINLLSGWEHVDGVQTGSELVGIDSSVSWDVEDVEGVSEVEVVLLCEGDLGVLDLLLLSAEVFDSVNELILVVDSEDWLSAWGNSGWADGGSCWSWSDWR